MLVCLFVRLAPLGSVSRLETLDIDGNLTGSFMNTALDESRQLLRFPGIGMFICYTDTCVPNTWHDVNIHHMLT